MKSIKFLFPVLIIVLFFTSCKSDDESVTTLVDFEDVAVEADSLSANNSFVSSNCVFYGDKTMFWSGGILCSSHRDTITSGYLNEYSAITGCGANNSKKYGVIYESTYLPVYASSFVCRPNSNGYYSIKSLKITNSTYAYLDMKNGSVGISKKFSSGDWFKVTISGYKDKSKTSSVDYYLADFRNGKSIIVNKWNDVDLSALGQVDSVVFNFDSSDKSNGSINTPSYVCIDNIQLSQTVSQNK